MNLISGQYSQPMPACYRQGNFALRDPLQQGALRAAISYIVDGSECVMEFAGTTKLDDSTPSKDNYQPGAIDHFTVHKEGKISHMVVFLRPKSLTTQGNAQ